MSTSESPPVPERPTEPTDPYEFSEVQNALIGRLASRMSFVGVFAAVTGLVSIVFGATKRDPGTVLLGILYGLIGVWTARAGASFHSVAVTTGHDIANLMKALDELRKVFTLQYWLCLIALVLALLLLGTTAVGTFG
jgi:hypothetical protein